MKTQRILRTAFGLIVILMMGVAMTGCGKDIIVPPVDDPNGDTGSGGNSGVRAYDGS